MATCVYTHPNTLRTCVTMCAHMCNYMPSMCQHTCEPTHIHMDNNNTCEPMCAKNQVWAHVNVCVHMCSCTYTHTLSQRHCAPMPTSNMNVCMLQHMVTHKCAWVHANTCSCVTRVLLACIYIHQHVYAAHSQTHTVVKQIHEEQRGKQK